MHSSVALVVLLPVACALSLLPSRSERAASFLQKEGTRLDSAELLKLGNEVRGPDDLDKVKQMIGHMIARHQEAQADDTDHKSFCDKEVKASKAKLEKLKMEIEKRTADQDMHSAQLAQLKDSISDLHAEIANSHKARAKAAELRENEASAYKQAKAEADKTLIELKAGLRSDIPSQRKAAQDAEEEITLKQVKAENKEEDAQYQFKKMDGEIAVAIARKTKEVEQKERKTVSATHELSLGDGDTKMAKEELDAAQGYEEKIKSSCTVRQDPVKERKIARENQIHSLKEAYGILSGDDFLR